ncbi:MAG: bacteriohemerythrin [Thermodesulfobacteriota bacterium]
MASLTWNDSYSVNIREIDDQHKRLLALVGNLHAAMMQGQGKQALGKILDGVVAYAASHFATEERLMKTHGYPEYEEHRNIHAKMTQKVVDIQKQYHQGKVNITLDTMKFLEDWVAKHILGTDKKYGPFLNSKGVL